MVILYSAPLPPEVSGNYGSPGAMRKIALTIRALKDLGYTVILIDSSHLSPIDNFFRNASVSDRKFGQHTIKVISPSQIWNRKLGKTIQVLGAERIGQLAEMISKIDIVLIYNAYLFEVRIARYFQQKYNVPYILQLEDLPWARRRGRSPTPRKRLALR